MCAASHQARVITVGQVLPLWIRTSTLVRIVVTAAWSGGKPAASALLGPGVEVVIAPKVRRRAPPAASPGPSGAPGRAGRAATRLRVACAGWLAPVAEAGCAYVCRQTAERIAAGGGGGGSAHDNAVWVVALRRRGGRGDSGGAGGAGEEDKDGKEGTAGAGEVAVRLRIHDAAMPCAAGAVG
jgi:hypothetical protein